MRRGVAVIRVWCACDVAMMVFILLTIRIYLSLAGNKIFLKGFLILAEALNKSNKDGLEDEDAHMYMLDVSDCKIATKTSDYGLLEGKRLGTKIPVLDLSGNHFSSRTHRFWTYLLTVC